MINNNLITEEIGEEIVIIGYSGHSFSCIEVLIKQGISIGGYYDLQEKKFNPYNLKYLGNEEKISSNSIPFIAIGDNYIRSQVYQKLKTKKIHLKRNLIHPDSTISSSAIIEGQIYIGSRVILNSQSKIAVGCIINSGAIIEHDCSIGKFTHIAPGAIVTGNVSIGDNCLIGANSTILPNIKIGDNAIIGAGSVVVKNIESNTKYAGNPARQI